MVNFRTYIKESEGSVLMNNYYDMPRTKNLDRYEATKLLNTKCKKTVSSGNFLYRESKDTGSDYALTDPTSGEPRVSRNIVNYFTLLIDNLPSWKKFPKRSRSVVCSTTMAGAYGYGSGTVKKVVVPFDGVKIGLCSDSDYWDSFERIGSVYNFVNTLHREFGLYGMEVNDKSWPDLKKALIKLSVGDVNEGPFYKFGDITKHWDCKGDFIKHLDDILNPYDNGFKLFKAGDKLHSGNHEAWVGGKCVIVRSRIFEEFIKGI